MANNCFKVSDNIIKAEINSPKYGKIYTTMDIDNIWVLCKYKLRVKYDKTIKNFYVYTGHMEDGKWVINALHRVITKCPKGLQVDHIDRNPLNNTKSNLRICNSKINNNNRKVRADNKVGVSGISYNSKTKKYTLRITNNDGSRKYIGSYNTKIEALDAHKEVIANAL